MEGKKKKQPRFVAFVVSLGQILPVRWILSLPSFFLPSLPLLYFFLLSLYIPPGCVCQGLQQTKPLPPAPLWQVHHCRVRGTGRRCTQLAPVRLLHPRSGWFHTPGRASCNYPATRAATPFAWHQGRLPGDWKSRAAGLRAPRMCRGAACL